MHYYNSSSYLLLDVQTGFKSEASVRKCFLIQICDCRLLQVYFFIFNNQVHSIIFSKLNRYTCIYINSEVSTDSKAQSKSTPALGSFQMGARLAQTGYCTTPLRTITNCFIHQIFKFIQTSIINRVIPPFVMQAILQKS